MYELNYLSLYETIFKKLFYRKMLLVLILSAKVLKM